MTDEKSNILEHSELGSGYRRLTVAAPRLAAELEPGQFVHVRIPALESSALRRPFSVFEGVDSVQDRGTRNHSLEQGRSRR